MFSPPPEEVQSASDIRHWRAKSVQIAQENGIDAGIAAFHGYRISDRIIDLFDEHIAPTEYDETATDVLLWEWIRTGEWEQYVTWGPHMHIVGLVDDFSTDTDEGILKHLRTFPEYTHKPDTQKEKPETLEAISEHRAVGKDMVDHLTFDPSNPWPPFGWFGGLEGDSWYSAAELLPNEQITAIRSDLIETNHSPTTAQPK